MFDKLKELFNKKSKKSTKTEKKEQEKVNLTTPRAFDAELMRKLMSEGYKPSASQIKQIEEHTMQQLQESERISKLDSDKILRPDIIKSQTLQKPIKKKTRKKSTKKKRKKTTKKEKIKIEPKTEQEKPIQQQVQPEKKEQEKEIKEEKKIEQKPEEKVEEKVEVKEEIAPPESSSFGILFGAPKKIDLEKKPEAQDKKD